MEYPKKKRIVNKELIDKIMSEQKFCLIGWYGGFGSCYGEDCPHHIVHRGAGGGDVRGNIMRVCIQHHATIHNGLISKKLQYDILRKSGAKLE